MASSGTVLLYFTLLYFIPFEEWTRGSLNTAAWRVLKLRMKKSPDVECSCEYVEQRVTDGRHNMILRVWGLGGGAGNSQTLKKYGTLQKVTPYLEDDL
jgi:hypothetical protein